MSDYQPIIIDCGKVSNLASDRDSLLEFSTTFGNLLKEDGFLYLTNHGLSSKTIQSFFEKSKEFFNLSNETKGKYQADLFSNNGFGFVPSGIERAVESENPIRISNAITKREGFVFFPNDALKESKYPTEVSNWMPLVNEIFESFSSLIKLLLRAIAIYLKLEDEEYFLKAHKALDKTTLPSSTNLRSIFYFPLDPSMEIPPDRDIFRVLNHSDWGMLTFLIQDDTGGLESMRSNGDWVSVIPVENSIVLQVGQTMEMWTGGHFPAVPHRVRLTKENARASRQSIALFLHPDDETKWSPVTPLKKNWVPQYPNIGKFTHGEFIEERRRRGAAKVE